MSKKFGNPIKGCRGTHKNQHSNICSGFKVSKTKGNELPVPIALTSV